METQPQEQPHRNSCVTCRAKKIKCTPSEIPGTCQKCQRLQQECKLPGVISRPRRKKLISRIEQLEQNFGNVTAELEQRASESSSMPNSSHAQTAANTTDNLYSNPSTNLSASSPLLDNSDVFLKGILTVEHGERLLREFKNMARNFPFIVLTEGSNLSDFRHERPMLLLAILAAASWRDRPLQLTLEHEYLNELSVRMVVKAEQSLDILQGLLVHLAWCHFHLKSAYRLAAFAVSNVISLGLDCRPVTNRPGMNLRLNFEFVTRRPDPPLQSGFRGAEARRAYIGCYVVSTSYALCLRKATALRYSKYLEDCALSLAAENQTMSDTALIHYVRLIHHAEQTNEIFGYTDSDQFHHLTDERLQFYIQYFNAQWQTLRSNIPVGLSGDLALNSSHTLIYAYTQEIGLYNLSSTDLSPARMTILHDCLLSIQQILDLLTTISDQVLQSILGYSWARIYYSINMAMELTVGIVSPSWSIEAVRNIVKLETYLDVVYCRLISLSASIQPAEGKGNFFQVLAENLAGLRDKYANSLRVRGINIPDRETHILSSDSATIPPNPNVGSVPYGFADISSMDFMLNDWAWLPPDPNLFSNQPL